MYYICDIQGNKYKDVNDDVNVFVKKFLISS